MNVQRFTGRTSRDAMVKMRQALGDDAVVLSTKPCAEGIEMLAMAPGALAAVERSMAQPPAQPAAAPAKSAKLASKLPPPAQAEVEEDVAQLAMSTLSFQDYVRERMLKKREAALREAPAAPARRAEPPAEPQRAPIARTDDGVREPMFADDELSYARPTPAAARRAEASPAPRREAPVLREELAWRDEPAYAAPAPAQPDPAMMNELRAMKGLIEERFGALAFMEKLQRQPAQARLTQKLLDCGFSTALIRKLVDGLPQDSADELAWAAGVLERNLATGENESAIEDQGGVFAMIGSTGVGKTTSTAKLAAAFATKHGAANLGLVTLDAYRLGAHEQLRAYGRILGVPVHTAHDRTALEDLLDLLSAKKLVLIDTAGVAQRDSRTKDLLEMLSHRSINKLLVVNAAAQGETIEDVMISYRAATCRGIVLSKLDEAVKLAPAVDALIRHKLKVVGVANGQRVPEDWHRLSAQALVHRALRGGGSAAYRYDTSEMNLVFAAPLPANAARGARRTTA
ncbi:flagellar biosynthesis protein FlhF [Caldimonas sp. KR1-144]|uniref:flagellar biosynthesis protein FlhF n=1 Tax=Caldimonas sp. KR1-144 TaxID=3400911 RepID=UPI003C02AFB9